MAKAKKTNQFSLDSFAAFRPFINLYGCGQAVWESDRNGNLVKKTPFLISHETRELFERYRQGERGLTYKNGTAFEPWHFMASKLDANKIDQHIFGNETFYYTSNTKKLGLPYFDVDAHFQFQIDHAKARQLLIEFFGKDYIFFRDSSRGQNGYLKVYHEGQPAIFNGLLDRMAIATNLYLRSRGILADIEIKGHCHDQKYGRLAKLPFAQHFPYQKKESWNYDMLEDFKSKKVLTLGMLRYFINRLEAETDVEKALAFDEHVKELKRRETRLRHALADNPSTPDYAAEEEEPTITTKENDNDTYNRETPTSGGCHRERAAVGRLGTTGRPSAVETCLDGDRCCHRGAGPGRPEGTGAFAEQDDGLGQGHRSLPALPDETERSGDPGHAEGVRRRGGKALPGLAGGKYRREGSVYRNLIEQLRAIPDSLERQLKAGLLLTRLLGRVPTEQELLDFIEEHHLYTGDWDDNDGEREARVAWIVAYISRTFDPAKCRLSSGSVEIDVEKYRAWCKGRFPERISIEKQSIDEFMQGETSKAGYVTSEDVAVYLAIFEFCLENGQYLDDQGIPHARIVGFWQALHAKGLTDRGVNDRKVSVIREMLASRQIIEVIDRDYKPGKSMRYEYGKFFPFKGLWKDKDKKEKVGQSVVAGGRQLEEREEKELNYSTYASRWLLEPGDHARPPPDSS